MSHDHPQTNAEQRQLELDARRWRGFEKMFVFDPDRVFKDLKTCKHRNATTLRSFASTYATQLGTETE